MTAVEFLVNEFSEILGPLKTEPMQDMFIIDAINQAKKIEKQQQGYSEEEVLELLQKALTHKDDGETGSLVTAQGEIRPANFFSWFNKFKNK